jgi:hypothetical protein
LRIFPVLLVGLLLVLLVLVLGLLLVLPVPPVLVGSFTAGKRGDDEAPTVVVPPP